MGIPVKGFPRYIVDEYGTITNIKTGRTVRGRINNNGYRIVELFYETGKSKQLLLHRIVAEAFIPNPEGLPIINHKDENPLNNNAANLEWCTYKYNSNYGTAKERARKALETYRSSNKLKEIARRNGKAVSKAVKQYTKSGELIMRYPSGKSAALATGTNHSHIMETCNGKRKSAGGFVWAYEGSDDLSVFQF